MTVGLWNTVGKIFYKCQWRKSDNVFKKDQNEEGQKYLEKKKTFQYFHTRHNGNRWGIKLILKSIRGMKCIRFTECLFTPFTIGNRFHENSEKFSFFSVKIKLKKVKLWSELNDLWIQTETPLSIFSQRQREPQCPEKAAEKKVNKTANAVEAQHTNFNLRLLFYNPDHLGILQTRPQPLSSATGECC